MRAELPYQVVAMLVQWPAVRKKYGAGAVAHVEAERAARAAAVDGVAAGDVQGEHAGDVLDPDRVAEALDDRLELVELGAGDRAVDRDHDLVADRVDRPRGADDRCRAAEFGRDGGQLGAERATSFGVAPAARTRSAAAASVTFTTRAPEASR